MKVSQAVDYHVQYHQANSKKNTIKTCEFVLTRFSAKFGSRDIECLTHEEILTFLISLTVDTKQATKRNRCSVLTSFYNFTINTSLPDLINPCNTVIIKKVFRRSQPNQWQIVDKQICVQ
jgi:site-specific recombinase XerD